MTRKALTATSLTVAVCIVCLCMLGSSSAFGQVTTPKSLPTGPAPYQALAIADRNGNVTMRVSTSYWAPVSTVDPETKSVLTHYKQVSSLTTRQYPADQIKAHGSDGKPIETKRLRKLLRDEVHVMVSADGKAVDPLHLRVYKVGTIFLIPVDQPPQLVPVPVPAPVQVPLAPAAPAMLRVRIEGPAQLAVGRDTDFRIVLANEGGAPTGGLQIVVGLPNKIHIPLVDDTEYSGDVMSTVAGLKAGEQRTETLKIRASAKGEYQVPLVVTGDGSLRSEVSLRVTAVESQPKTPIMPPK